MIPLKLHIKNFLSYGPNLQAIDFGSYPLICLNGKNGHGKSALLDAMTWAVWGQARKISGTVKPDAQLVRLGQSNMMVIFDFVFNDNTYRIRREFTLSKGGNHITHLEFGIFDGKSDKINPLTDKTIRATQETIERLLGLDFDSFINSAFLRQGQSNEFSKKSPKDRKDILASILQLNKYEALRKAAHDNHKQILEQIHGLKTVQARINQELEKGTALSAQCTTIENQLATINRQLEDHEQKIIALDHDYNSLLVEQQQQERILHELEQKRKEKTNLQKTVNDLFIQWRITQRMLNTVVDHQYITQKKNHLNLNLERMIALQQELLALKESYLTLQTREQSLVHTLKEQHLIESKKNEIALERLETHIHHQKITIAQLQEQQSALNQEQNAISAMEQELITTMHSLSGMEQIKNFEQLFEKKKTYYHRWVARLQMLQQERANIAQKQYLTSDAANPSCPLCEQNLSASRKRFLYSKFIQLMQSLQHKQTRLTKILPLLKKVLLDEYKVLTQLRNEQQEHRLLSVKHKELIERSTIIKNTLEQLQTTIAQHQQELRQHTTTIEQMRAQLSNMQTEYSQTIFNTPEVVALRAEKNIVTLKIEQHPYNGQEHYQLQQALQQLQKQEQQLQDRSREQQEQEKRKNTIHELCNQLRMLKFIASDVSIAQERYTTLQKQLTSIRAEKNELSRTKLLMQQQKEELLRAQGRINQEQEHLKKLAYEYQEHEKSLLTMHTAAHDYQILTTTFGKDGIQALLIEDAIPEIEQEANNLLAKLTNNQAQIIIESLRDLKKGGTKETLDINISDPMGIRPYELFSGGEAFRIDFALRIAISKLLARRAGTSLQTLIIDEGFGSQDEEGLNLLTEALLKIQDDFAKIIIVSHLSSMKDQFPVHFFVHKNAHGSSVHIMEQG